MMTFGEARKRAVRTAIQEARAACDEAQRRIVAFSISAASAAPAVGPRTESTLYPEYSDADYVSALRNYLVKKEHPMDSNSIPRARAVQALAQAVVRTLEIDFSEEGDVLEAEALRASGRCFTLSHDLRDIIEARQLELRRRALKRSAAALTSQEGSKAAMSGKPASGIPVPAPAETITTAEPEGNVPPTTRTHLSSSF